MNTTLSKLEFDPVRHRYSVNGIVIPGVTEVLAPLSDFRWVRTDILRAASHLGTAVHRACELDDHGTLDEDSVEPVLRGFLHAWRRFCQDHQTVWQSIEGRLYHPAMGYAGTLDRFGTVEGVPTVVELKTSARLPATVGPQLAAYAKALPEGAPDVRRLAVQLRPDGQYRLRSYCDPMDWAVFASLLTLRAFCSQHRITPRF